MDSQLRLTVQTLSNSFRMVLGGAALDLKLCSAALCSTKVWIYAQQCCVCKHIFNSRIVSPNIILLLSLKLLTVILNCSVVSVSLIWCKWLDTRLCLIVINSYIKITSSLEQRRDICQWQTVPSWQLSGH